MKALNKVILIGRLTRDPEVRYSQRGMDTQEEICVARYTLAVDRRSRDGGTDFIPVVAFGRAGEFAEKYLHKGMKIVLTGHIQTGSYTNREGVKVYTTDVIAEDQEFAESKAVSERAQRGNGQTAAEHGRGTAGSYPVDGDGFIHIPDGVDDLPFS